jgi:hypothetical protein
MEKRSELEALAADAPDVKEDEGDTQVCEKAFSPETARNADEDEPCKDGMG